jgi:hypothetical protein
VIPVKSKVFLNSTLVDLYCSNEFLVAAYRRFKELEPKGPIRHGLYGTLPLHDRTMESSVLSMFLALESLTLFLEDRTTLNLYYPKENGRNLNESSERGSRLSSTSGINPSIEVWFTARSKN